MVSSRLEPVDSVLDKARQLPAMPQMRKGTVGPMIDFLQLSIPSVDVVPEPTADDLQQMFGVWKWGSTFVDRTVAGLARRCRELEGDLLERQKFKDWTHKYLDAKGIPIDPGGPHSECGCRIGDRMDFVFKRIAELEAEVERLRKAKDEFYGGGGNYQ